MVKQPAMESSEFTMSHEDFPALPGSARNSGGAGGGGGSGGQQQQQQQQQLSHQQQQQAQQHISSLVEHNKLGIGLHQDNPNLGTAVSQLQQQQQQPELQKKGIQTSPDGNIVYE